MEEEQVLFLDDDKTICVECYIKEQFWTNRFGWTMQRPACEGSACVNILLGSPVQTNSDLEQQGQGRQQSLALP